MMFFVTACSILSFYISLISKPSTEYGVKHTTAYAYAAANSVLITAAYAATNSMLITAANSMLITAGARLSQLLNLQHSSSCALLPVPHSSPAS